MTVTRQDNDQRKDRILALTIEKYVDSVTPVSSKVVAEMYPAHVSSATIRSVLADLEQDGMLSHPHTSAGRIPTEKGYRYYVDHLMNQINFLEDEKARIKLDYAKDRLELEDLLEKTSLDISKRTHYTSIITIDGMNQKIIYQGTNLITRYPDLQDIQKIQSILEALDEKEELLKLINRDLREKVEIFIGHELALTNFDHCSLVVSQYRAQNGMTGRMAVLGPTSMQYQQVFSTLDYFSNLIEELV